MVGPKTTGGACTFQTDWAPSANAFLSLDSANLVFWTIDDRANVQTAKTFPLNVPNVMVTGWNCLAVDDVGQYAFVMYNCIGPNFGDPILTGVATYSYNSNKDFKFVSNYILNNWPGNKPVCLGQPAVTSSSKYQQFTWGTNDQQIAPGHIGIYNK